MRPLHSPSTSIPWPWPQVVMEAGHEARDLHHEARDLRRSCSAVRCGEQGERWRSRRSIALYSSQIAVMITSNSDLNLTRIQLRSCRSRSPTGSWSDFDRITVGFWPNYNRMIQLRSGHDPIGLQLRPDRGQNLTVCRQCWALVHARSYCAFSIFVHGWKWTHRLWHSFKELRRLSNATKLY